MQFNPALAGFECLGCGARLAHGATDPVCPSCGRPLVARYDLDRVRRELTPADLDRYGGGLWRYRAVLPFATDFVPVRLGEGGTPLIPLPELARTLAVRELWLKEESGNATQSFKARGLALAVHAAALQGRGAIALPSAGNAGGAAAAYARALGLRCRVAIPEETPEVFGLELEALGAEVRRVPGTIADAGRALAEWAPAPEWWNVATFREPYRLEGKKTLGYEIAEQTDWRPPEVIFYPTGGGTGLVGMWRAFDELRSLGWISGAPPRLVAVQVEGCAPVVRAFSNGAARIAPWTDARTLASGLRVPSPFADELILRAIRDTGGTVVAVSEEQMLEAMVELSSAAGCVACPEGGATLAGLRALKRTRWIGDEERIVIFNTGSGLKYVEAWRVALERRVARVERR